MNVVIKHSRLVFAEWFENKLDRAEFKVLLKLNSIWFNKFRQYQLEKMTIDNAYEGDIESNSENETSEKQNALRTRYRRRHFRFRRSKPSQIHLYSILNNGKIKSRCLLSNFRSKTKLKFAKFTMNLSLRNKKERPKSNISEIMLSPQYSKDFNLFSIIMTGIDNQKQQDKKPPGQIFFMSDIMPIQSS